MGNVRVIIDFLAGDLAGEGAPFKRS